MVVKVPTLWGSGKAGQLGLGYPLELSVFPYAQTPNLLNVKQVGLGGSWGGVLLNDGTVWTQGDTFFGSAGQGVVGEANNVYVPSKVSFARLGIGDNQVEELAFGEGSGMVRFKNGQCAGWGANGSPGIQGVLGVGDALPHYSPIAYVQTEAGVPLKEVVQVVMGSGVCWFLLASGLVYRTGIAYRQGTNLYAEPVIDNSTGKPLEGVAEIAGSELTACFRKTDGSIWTKGTSGYGQLGNNTIVAATTSTEAEPIQKLTLPVGRTVTRIAAAEYHFLALMDNGHLLSWGRNSEGQLGNGLEGEFVPGEHCVLVPTEVPGIEKVVAIACGGGRSSGGTQGAQFSMALLESGGVRAWGGNNKGQLADATRFNKPSPIETLAGYTGITQIVASEEHAALLQASVASIPQSVYEIKAGIGTFTAKWNQAFATLMEAKGPKGETIKDKVESWTLKWRREEFNPGYFPLTGPTKATESLFTMSGASVKGVKNGRQMIVETLPGGETHFKVGTTYYVVKPTKEGATFELAEDEAGTKIVKCTAELTAENTTLLLVEGKKQEPWNTSVPTTNMAKGTKEVTVTPTFAETWPNASNLLEVVLEANYKNVNAVSTATSHVIGAEEWQVEWTDKLNPAGEKEPGWSGQARRKTKVAGEQEPLTQFNGFSKEGPGPTSFKLRPWEEPFKLTGTAVLKAKLLPLEKAGLKGFEVGKRVKFTKLPTGSQFIKNTFYYLVRADELGIEIALTEGGAALEVETKELTESTCTLELQMVAGEGLYKPTGPTKTTESRIQLTGAQGSGFHNARRVKFPKLPGGITTLDTTTSYFVVGVSPTAVEAGGFQVSATEGGAAITPDKELTAANTEVALGELEVTECLGAFDPIFDIRTQFVVVEKTGGGFAGELPRLSGINLPGTTGLISAPYVTSPHERPQVGDLLTASPGVWTDASKLPINPTGYRYQWWSKEQNAESGWTKIPGATNSSYEVQEAYLGQGIQVEVWAENSVGVAYFGQRSALTLAVVVEVPELPPGVSSPYGTAPGATVDVTVRLQALGGTWETCGADRAVKVMPETVTVSSNEWGPDKASFNLHRSPIAIWPDIGAYSPVEIEVGGVIVWEGRTDDTPLKAGTEQIINVQCQGWQYHLDDDVYQRTYVHAKLTDWKDTRSFPEADLTVSKTSGSIQVGQGAITLGYAKGAQITPNQGVAVTLDLGPASPGAVAVAADAKLVGVATNFSFYAMLHDGWGGGYTLAGREDAWAAQPLATGSYGGSLAKAHRYVTLLVLYTGAEATLAADMLLTLTGVRVFTDVSFSSSGVSILKASTIIPDALERATMLLSADLSQIHPTSFAIPDFTMGKLSTPREMIEAANAYHNWITKLERDKRVAFRERPADATLEIGAWSGASLEDASANSGAEIYNRAVVEATGADGSPLVAERSAAQQPGALFLVPSTPSADNPSFVTNTASWSVTAGVLTRNTEAGNYRTAPACGKWALEAEAGKLIETFTGTFKRGVTYRVGVWLKSIEPSRPVEATFGVAEDNATSVTVIVSEGYTQATVAWTPTRDRTGVTLGLHLSAHTFFGGAYVDDVSLTTAAPTIVDRRGFRRTKVIQMSSAITATEGNQLADIFLQAHMTTPFKGSAAVSPGGVRRVLGGQPVHPSQLGLHTQELLRLSHFVDPDSGGVSRDGTIAEVTYTHKDQKAAIVLDDKRGNFDALLARLAVVQSVGS
jgi:alpha-tubulin suppressor-like RCC1 family protein